MLSKVNQAQFLSLDYDKKSSVHDKKKQIRVALFLVYL